MKSSKDGLERAILGFTTMLRSVHYEATQCSLRSYTVFTAIAQFVQRSETGRFYIQARLQYVAIAFQLVLGTFCYVHSKFHSVLYRSHTVPATTYPFKPVYTQSYPFSLSSHTVTDTFKTGMRLDLLYIWPLHLSVFIPILTVHVET
jgi:hypothetical protein